MAMEHIYVEPSDLAAQLVEQIEESCDSRGADPDQFLRSLLPMDKRDAALPPVRIL